MTHRAHGTGCMSSSSTTCLSCKEAENAGATAHIQDNLALDEVGVFHERVLVATCAHSVLHRQWLSLLAARAGAAACCLLTCSISSCMPACLGTGQHSALLRGCRAGLGHAVVGIAVSVVVGAGRRVGMAHGPQYFCC